MIAKITSYKLYFKLICFSLIFFFSISTFLNAAVLTEEEIRYIESQTNDSNDNEEYIKYEDIKEKKQKRNPFNFFSVTNKKKKKEKTIKKKNFF